MLCLGRFLYLDLLFSTDRKLLCVGLSGYTALIIVITIQTEPLLTPQFALERCSEIVIGIGCAILADLLFSPRSIKQEVDRELDSLLVAQYQLMQLCIKHGDSEEVDNAWGDLVRRTAALEGCEVI
ncbi:fusaric acid resistance protein FusB/ fusaricacid resistance protein FusC [Salmonella enterica subsp. enterica]|uniref:Fusaric acid resistance protein FusB/ fusaricacid resistance protein FusC n=1 Tax=Salmonella enterica I TaxID=59201 RepID=A0A379WLV5_SALET|nr:fusaric acid resistance protein FusB/ fusaricacid resistance protein FusC [Salmonella enterica subsp. enterica]